MYFLFQKKRNFDITYPYPVFLLHILLVYLFFWSPLHTSSHCNLISVFPPSSPLPSLPLFLPSCLSLFLSLTTLLKSLYLKSLMIPHDKPNKCFFIYDFLLLNYFFFLKTLYCLSSTLLILMFSSLCFQELLIFCVLLKC